MPHSGKAATGAEIAGRRIFVFFCDSALGLASSIRSNGSVTGALVGVTLSEAVENVAGTTSAERAQGVLLEVVARYATHRGLSPRQARILFEHLRGQHDKEIASELRCRECTIYEHWRRM